LSEQGVIAFLSRFVVAGTTISTQKSPKRLGAATKISVYYNTCRSLANGGLKFLA
jgi:hypothetical protein